MCAHPKVDGTFIQWDMTSAWGNDQWESELRYLREAGMHYLILSNCSSTRNNTTRTIYPTSIPGFMKEDIQKDIVEHCLRNAQKTGIRVFLGIHFNDEWWKKVPDHPEWLYEQIALGNQVADELYTRYHHRYPDTFYGWYWVYEVDNIHFNARKHFTILAKAINMQLEHFETMRERLPLMLSPFMNALFSTPHKYAEHWKYVFANTALGNGDIFCPQDCVGGGGLKIHNLNSWFAALKKAVDSKPGLAFWSNTENFDYHDWTSAPLNRFIHQLEIESTYVSNSITFSYSHFYSPNNIDSGFHEAYTGYVRNGFVQERKPPAPINVTFRKMSSYQVQVAWKSPPTSSRICGYIVYRNNKRIFKTCVQRKYGSSIKGPLTSYIDKDPIKIPILNTQYTVSTFDFWGNESERIKARG